ncbi:Pectin lyase-like superfamily protein [Euphorbia peplus]|nr:Pectin lyase-like superfamily protein [Euphorbia peplus]
MKNPAFGAFLVIFISFFFVCVKFQLGLAQYADLINWDDLRVNDDHARLSSRDTYNLTHLIIVDKDGRGDSLTVQGAIDMVPLNNTARVKIVILPGIYREKVFISSKKPYISFIGKDDQISETIITWNNKASDTDSNGEELGTYRSASVTVESDYFCATGITFENTVVAVPGGFGMQAVALRISGDKAFFYKVRILGTQDTLLDEAGSHFYYRCHIQGTVDFIFGRGRSLFQDCALQSTARKSGAIAAHHRDTPDDDSGFSFIGCTINGTGRVLLGRAWGNYSRTIYSYCYFNDIITPSGWSDWNFPYRQKTVVFGEYECSGRGADTRARVPWSKNFTYEEVRPFLDMNFINGDQWLRL